MQLTRPLLALALAGVIGFGCGGGGEPDAPPDASVGPADAALPDASPPDAPSAADAAILVDAIPGLCDSEERDDDYAPGLMKVGDGGYRFILESMAPPPPRKGMSEWVLRIEDPTGVPVDALTLGVYPFMPDHGHGTGVRAVVTSMGGGRYDLNPVNLFMTGYWTIRIAARQGDVDVDQVVFSFCVHTITS